MKIKLKSFENCEKLLIEGCALFDISMSHDLIIKNLSSLASSSSTKAALNNPKIPKFFTKPLLH
jgi:hypothetical protein